MKKCIKIQKKSQIFPFIILAIIILAVIIVYFGLRPDVKSSKISPEIFPLFNFVENCVQKVTGDAIYNIGETGGYFFAPNLSIDNIAYYFYEKENYMPSKEKIEDELSDYINSMLFFCTKNFEDFNDYEVNQREIATKTIIEDEKIVFNIDYQLSIKKDKASYLIEGFELEVPVRLGVIHKVANEIMKEQMEEKDAICISCIGELAEENDLFVDLRDYENDSIIFYIIDRNSEINEDVYVFNFANRYEKYENEV